MKTIRFKIGDKVMIKDKNWYASGKKLSVNWIFKNGDMRLLIHKENGKPTDDAEIIERYEPEDLKQGWSKKERDRER